MNNQPDLIADEINLSSEKRIKLIPLWIKIFAWIFLVLSAFSIVVLAIGIVGGTASLSLYGLATDEPLTLTGILITGCFMFKGLVAFGLLKEKDWAVKAGIADAIIGIVACTFVMIYPLISGTFHLSIRLELIALIPYLVKLTQIRIQWEETIA